MQTRRRFLHTAGALGLSGSFFLSPRMSRAGDDPGLVRIGIVKSIFHGYPSTWINFITQPLKALMQAQTGLRGEVLLMEDAETLAKELNANKVHLGVFHGIELGWAWQHAPKLKPMVISIRGGVATRACLVTGKDLGAATIDDLKGKAISIEKRSRLHCRLFLGRRCPNPVTNPEKFFCKVELATSATRGLDAVAKGDSDAVIVDDVALAEYQRTKALRFADLHVLQQSELFPPGVIAYHPDHLSDSKLRKLKDGLRTAHTNARGKHLLRLTRIDRFEEVPEDFEELVRESAKHYPCEVK